MTFDIEMENARRDRHLTLTDKHPQRVANVLIVDDDVDTALFVQRTFAQMGCNIEFALDAAEARRKMCSGKADLIVLDWMLDHMVSADQVMAGAAKRMEKFRSSRGRNQFSRIKVITFSGRSESGIFLPDSPFFEHVDHWRKPMKYDELTRRTVEVMNRLGF